MNSIKLKIENLGLIRKADIELKRLNVIAGINGSGKTTSSKILYCLLIANSGEGIYLSNKSIHNRFVSLIKNIELQTNQSNISFLLDNLPSIKDPLYNKKISENIIQLKNNLKNINGYMDEIRLMEKVVNINNIENRRYFEVSNALLKSEFDFTELDFNNTNISLHGEINECAFLYELKNIEDKIGFSIEQGKLNCLNIENVIYIDSPSVFDVKNNNSKFFENSTHHIDYLFELINSNKNNVDVYDDEFNKKLDTIEEMIRKMIGGHIYYNKKTNEFIFKKK